MSSIPTADDVLDPTEPVIELQEVAKMLRIPLTKVQQHLRDGHLLAVRRDRVIAVPRIFFTEAGAVVKPLPGLLSVLRDGGYRDTEIMRWLFTADPTLTLTFDGSQEVRENARPVDALHAHQAREVVRRAQAMAY